MNQDIDSSDLDGYISEWLDRIEASPKLYAHEFEALEVLYLSLLHVLLKLRGKEDCEVFNRHIKAIAVPYGPQNNLPIWARKGNEDMTHQDVLVYLKKVREETAK